ncbi:hypothetical protein [Nonlabens antarcticus]|uniref:hypothetical protein n=1 Tax=Nonlabens antarcticus TaxID=392714 RepID=UPI0018910895|nr:hypothetical protein [Nonlabens antarcticus]
MHTVQQPSHNLELLRILYIVKASFNFLGVLFFIAYASFGALMFNFMDEIPNANGSEEFPSQLSWIFVIIGVLGALICLVFAVVTLIAAKRIKERRNETFIFVVGVINCFTGILGIGLGVFTFVEMTKPHVKALFQPSVQDSTEF